MEPGITELHVKGNDVLRGLPCLQQGSRSAYSIELGGFPLAAVVFSSLLIKHLQHILRSACTRFVGHLRTLFRLYTYS